MVLFEIVVGIVSAVIYAAIGYGSGKLVDTEMKFEKYKLIQTVISGIIAGVILMILGIPISFENVNEVISVLSGNVFFIFLLNKITNVIYERLAKYYKFLEGVEKIVRESK